MEVSDTEMIVLLLFACTLSLTLFMRFMNRFLSKLV